MPIVSLAEAAEKLRAQEVVALPSETVYGLAGRIDSELALKKIFSVKQRPSFDPLIVHVTGIEQAKTLVKEWPEIYSTLAAKFWPGPLTLIAPKRDKVSDTITSGLDSVAIRSPAHPVFQEVLRLVGVPLAAPSANRFGRTSPTEAQHVEKEFPVAIVDGGPCSVGVESTVLRAEGNRLEILRPGGITRSQLSEFLVEQKLSFTVTRAQSKVSPGQLEHHYQPESKLVLLNERSWTSEIANRVNVTSATELKLGKTPQETARVLYSDLRRLSKNSQHAIFIIRRKEQAGQDWEAIWDRVERASSLIL